MKAVDTDILVRIVARDDPEQLRLAREIIVAGDLLILPTVLLEAEWVLRSRYKVDRGEIGRRLSALCGQDNVTVMSAAAVASALAAYTQAGDFADLLHFAIASEAGATSFVTFDRTFVPLEEAGPNLQII